MPGLAHSAIRGIVFDLDGTLYVSEPFAATIQEAAVGYIAALKGISGDEARSLMVAARSRLSESAWHYPHPLGGLHRTGREHPGPACRL